MSDVFCKQCGVTDDQQAKYDDGCGVFCQECDEFIDMEEDTEEGKMNYRGLCSRCENRIFGGIENWQERQFHDQAEAEYDRLVGQREKQEEEYAEEAR
jgi:hypothetical protein